ECGGPTHEHTRLCEFCRAPVATLRCAHCFQMNVPDNDYCAGCGHGLGLEPVELPSELNCPECNAAFSSFDGSPGLLHDCRVCGGQFVEHHLLQELLERRRRFFRAITSLKPRDPS